MIRGKARAATPLPAAARVLTFFASGGAAGFHGDLRTIDENFVHGHQEGTGGANASSGKRFCQGL